MEKCIDCGAPMEYIGNHEWECTECGTIYEIDGIDYDDYDEDECLSVYDAALIWISNGMDEDYTFGYSEEELKNAL